MASKTYSRKKTNWKKPKTISERWEDWFPSPDPDDVRQTNRRGRQTGPSKNERLDIEQDKRESELAAAINQRTKDLNLGYSSREALKEAYERGEVTDYDINVGGVKGFYDDPTQNDLATETVPNEGGDDKDDTSSGVIEQTTGDDGIQASIENENQTVKDIERQIAIANNEKYLKSVSWDGMNRTYTTNYREAVKNAAGWSAYYDEPDELGNPIKKSDVFTRGEDGQPLGVMTRSQRRAYDMKMHESKMKSKHSLVQTPSPTWGVEEKKKSSKPNLVQTPSPTWGVGDGTPDPSVSAASKGETTFDPDKNRKKGGS